MAAAAKATIAATLNWPAPARAPRVKAITVKTVVAVVQRGVDLSISAG